MRKNGVPYSADAVMTEYFDRFDVPGGDSLLVVSTEVVDPTYLAQPFWTSTHFKQQNDATDGIRRRARPDDAEPPWHAAARRLGAIGPRGRHDVRHAPRSGTAGPGTEGSGTGIRHLRLLDAAVHEDALDRGAGPGTGDYGGVPINEAGRLFALSYNASRVTLRHHQCDGYVAPVPIRAIGTRAPGKNATRTRSV